MGVSLTEPCCFLNNPINGDTAKVGLCLFEFPFKQQNSAY